MFVLTWIKLYRDPQKSLRMHLLKKLVNLAVKTADKVFPEKKASSPAAKLYTCVIEKMIETAEAEKTQNPRDENWVQLLKTGLKIIKFFGETDPYYSLWIGYLFKHSHRVYMEGLEEYSEILEEQGEDHPEFKQLKDRRFQEKAFNLKICGGLQLYDEKEK